MMSRSDGVFAPAPIRILVSIATAVVILGAATVPMFTAPWVDAAQDRAEVPAWTGFEREDVRRVTAELISDLVVGPPAFAAELRGVPVLSDAERGHLRDVRTVLAAFAGVVVLGTAVVLGALVAARRGPVARASVLGAIRRGAVGLVVVLVVAGIAAIVAFDAAFELFHRILFSGGNWSFDPSTDRLVQLFPARFWQETAVAVGAVAIATGSVVARSARTKPSGTDLATREGT